MFMLFVCFNVCNLVYVCFIFVFTFKIALLTGRIDSTFENKALNSSLFNIS